MADPRSEPSMEDILASIKRIIADDQPLPPDRPPPPAPVARPDLPRPAAWPEQAPAVFDRPSSWPARTDPPQPPETILELTELLPEPAQSPRAPAASPVVPPDPPAPQYEAPVQPAAGPLRQPDISWQAPEEAAPPAPAPSLAPRAVTRDIGELIVNRGAGGDNTLEGLVRDMLRPMLSDWIDTHVPAMVERLVQEEIRKMMEREGGSQ